MGWGRGGRRGGGGRRVGQGGEGRGEGRRAVAVVGRLDPGQNSRAGGTCDARSAHTFPALEESTTVFVLIISFSLSPAFALHILA